jgi:hypothetical protein
MYRYNPPFTCANLAEFWNFESSHQQNILRLKAAIEDKFKNQLQPFIKWGIPVYCIEIKKKFKPICHFIYLKENKTKNLLFHLGFFQGFKMFDTYNLFEPTKMTMVRGIPIKLLDQELLEPVLEYIEQAIEIRLEEK